MYAGACRLRPLSCGIFYMNIKGGFLSLLILRIRARVHGTAQMGQIHMDLKRRDTPISQFKIALCQPARRGVHGILLFAATPAQTIA